MKLSAKRINEMQEMMLALTDQEGRVGMNESPDRLGQAVLQRLPCSSFKRQQTLRYIFRSRPFTFFFHCFSEMPDCNCNVIVFLQAINFLSKKTIFEISLAKRKQL